MRSAPVPGSRICRLRLETAPALAQSGQMTTQFLYLQSRSRRAGMSPTGLPRTQIQRLDILLNGVRRFVLVFVVVVIVVIIAIIVGKM